MTILRKAISKLELREQYAYYFEVFTKAVVDVERHVMAINAELHADLETELIEDGSKPEHLWGINLYPVATKNNFIEYSALINIRPEEDNPSMNILADDLRLAIENIVSEWIINEAETT